MKIEISHDTKDAADLAGLRALIAALDTTRTVTSGSPLNGDTVVLDGIAARLDTLRRRRSALLLLL